MSKSDKIEADRLNDAAVESWKSGDEVKAISLANEALKINPKKSFAIINRYYFEECIKAKEMDSDCRRKRKIEKVCENNSPASPRVSVILPTYNRADLLAEALSSVLAQTMPDFEVLVVNDGGPQDAEEVCQRANDNRVRYALITHSGLSGALNAGLEMARGGYIAYLDDDDLYKPNHLAVLLDAIEKWGREGVVYSDADRVTGERKSDGNWTWSEPMLSYREDFSCEKLIRQNFILDLSVLHPRKIALEVGGYHEGISYGINWEMWLKLSAKYPFKRIPTTTAIFRDMKAETMSTDPQRCRQHSRNVIIYTHRLMALSRAKLKTASKIENLLESILEIEPKAVEMIDIRELIAGKPYAMFYKLGDYLAGSGNTNAARRAYIAAIKLAPWEFKSVARLISLSFGSAGVE